MPIPLIVLGVVLLLLILLLTLRIRLVITYRQAVCVQLRILWLRIPLYPRRKKLKIRQYSKKRLARAEHKKRKQELKKNKRQAQHASAPKERRTLQDNIRWVRALSAALIRRTNKHLRLHAARLHIRVATGDAASTAVLYGAVCASLSYLLTGLDRVTRLHATVPDVCVEPDFLSERPTADVKIIFSIRVFAAIATALSLVIAHMRHKNRVKRTKRKQKNNLPIKKGA